MPSHLGVPDAWQGRVDVEVTTLARGQRRVSSIKGVDPAAHVRRALRVTP